MRVVLDTNVLVSGIFFGGKPASILEAWVRGTFELVVTPQILTEYLRTCERLADSHPHLTYASTLTRIIGHASLVADPREGDAITADRDDDKFMRAAKGHGATVVSGDAHLLNARGWEGVEVLRPAEFIESLADQA